MIRKRVIQDLTYTFSEDSSTTATLPSDITNDTAEGEQEEEDNNLTYVMMSGRRIEQCIPIKEFIDGNGMKHTLAKFPVIQTGIKQKKQARVQVCRACSKETTMFCFECGKPLCFSVDGRGHGRLCFQEHIPRRSSGRISSSV